LAGAGAADGSAQAAAIVPTPPAAARAVDTGAPGDNQNLLLLFTLGMVAIPVLLTMTLVATVLTRR
jgi:hypothetical protein